MFDHAGRPDRTQVRRSWLWLDRSHRESQEDGLAVALRELEQRYDGRRPGLRVLPTPAAPPRPPRRVFWLRRALVLAVVSAIVVGSVVAVRALSRGSDAPVAHGEVGKVGVAIDSVEDMRVLFDGIPLDQVSTSMTINGPAPMILAMFMNCAIDQQVEKHLKEDPARWQTAEKKLDELFEGRERPRYHGSLPPRNDGMDMGLLGVSAPESMERDGDDA